MALVKKTETKNGGGIRRRRILVLTDAAISVTLAVVSAGSIASDGGKYKNIRSRITALDANKQESATLVGVQGRAIADGAGNLALYLWAAAAVSVPINGYLCVDIEEDLTPNGD